MSKIDEKMDKAANKIADSNHLLLSACNKAAYNGFIAGANWSLSHQWRSVDEVLPPYDTDIIGIENESVYLCKRENMSDGEDVYIINDAGSFNPTHWMPIPKIGE